MSTDFEHEEKDKVQVPQRNEMLKVHSCRYKNLPIHSSSYKKCHHADCAL